MMKRQLSAFMAVFLILTFSSLSIHSQAPVPHTNVRDEKAPPCKSKNPVQSVGEKITIFFHGLMVARYHEGMTKFEVGAIYETKEHSFSFQIWQGDSVRGIGNTCEITLDEKQLYEFDIVNSQGPTGNVLTGFTHNQYFDRKRLDTSDPENLQDYRYILDMEREDFHEKILKRKPMPFNYVFHVLKGQLRSKCLTQVLVKKRRNWQIMLPHRDYGFIAEIMGVDITLTQGQRLVLKSTATGREVWSCAYESQKAAEARVLNLPNDIYSLLRKQDPNSDYLTWACVAHPEMEHETSHFHYYYDLALKGGLGMNHYHLKAEWDLTPNYSATGPSGPSRKRTIFPYKCGMILQGKSDDPIDQDDMRR